MKVNLCSKKLKISGSYCNCSNQCSGISKNYKERFYYFSPFNNNKSLMLDLITKNGLCLKYVSYELKCDKDFVLTAVKQNGMALEYASCDLKLDKDKLSLEYNKNGNGIGLHICQNIVKHLMVQVLHTIAYTKRIDNDLKQLQAYQ